MKRFHLGFRKRKYVNLTSVMRFITSGKAKTCKRCGG
jgi:hypothetical protein